MIIGNKNEFSNIFSDTCISTTFIDDAKTINETPDFNVKKLLLTVIFIYGWRDICKY